MRLTCIKAITALKQLVEDGEELGAERHVMGQCSFTGHPKHKLGKVLTRLVCLLLRGGGGVVLSPSQPEPLGLCQ